MIQETFMEMAEEKRRLKMGLCVGIDPVKDKLPPGVKLDRFIVGLVEATAPYAAAFKPNIAFFEKMGASFWLNYHLAVTMIKRVDPFTPIIGDAKRGDIGPTNLGYIESLFDDFEVDATTVHNYLGRESLQKFLERKEKGIIVLCRTSNPGAGEFQDLMVDVSSRPILGQNMAPLYQKVADNVYQDWNTNLNCGLVVGATYPTEIELVRQIAPKMFILIPGVGTQGGDLEAAVRNAYIRSGGADLVISVSSGISEAWTKYPDLPWDEAAAKAAEGYHNQISKILDKLDKSAS